MTETCDYSALARDKTALELAMELYEDHPTGCCLHIVLDDQNTNLGCVIFCLEYAKGHRPIWGGMGIGWKPGFFEPHELCIQIAEKLLDMSEPEREAFCDRHEYASY